MFGKIEADKQLRVRVCREIFQLHHDPITQQKPLRVGTSRVAAPSACLEPLRVE